MGHVLAAAARRALQSPPPRSRMACYRRSSIARVPAHSPWMLKQHLPTRFEAFVPTPPPRRMVTCQTCARVEELSGCGRSTPPPPGPLLPPVAAVARPPTVPPSLQTCLQSLFFCPCSGCGHSTGLSSSKHRAFGENVARTVLPIARAFCAVARIPVKVASSDVVLADFHIVSPEPGVGEDARASVYQHDPAARTPGRQSCQQPTLRFELVE